MKFGVVASIRGKSVPMFLNRNGQWITDVNDMECFSSIIDALESVKDVIQCCPENSIIGVKIEFSGFIRDHHEKKV